MKKSVLIALVSVVAIGAQAALISNEGASDPSGGIAQNLSTAEVGNREVSWRSDTIHSQVGQSFMATADGVAKGISLYLTSPEDFTLYASPITFKLKVFSGVTAGAAVELGSYVYDASALDGTANTWLRFGLDSGVAMTSGSAYSFILTFDSLNAAHRLNFQRNKGLIADEYAGGAELRPAATANLYNAANFDADPWDVASGNPVVELGASDLRFAVDAIPEPATLGLFAILGGAILGARRIFSL